MKAASQEFADDPCSSMKRGAMVRAARALLSSVARLLIVADMVDVHLLLSALRMVSQRTLDWTSNPCACLSLPRSRAGLDTLFFQKFKYKYTLIAI